MGASRGRGLFVMGGQIDPAPPWGAPRGWGWGRLLPKSKLVLKWSLNTKFELSNNKTTATNKITWNSGFSSKEKNRPFIYANIYKWVRMADIRQGFFSTLIP